MDLESVSGISDLLGNKRRLRTKQRKECGCGIFIAILCSSIQEGPPDSTISGLYVKGR